MDKYILFLIAAALIIGLLLPNQLVFAERHDNNYIDVRLSIPVGYDGIIELYGEEGFYIYDKEDLINDKEFIGLNNIKITMDKRYGIKVIGLHDELLFSCNPSENLVIASFCKRERMIKVNGKYYRDYINIKMINGNPIIINHVELENYLYGVVPKEMSPSFFDLEALKAQAIAARTYALKNINKHGVEGYNLCDSTHCQAYGGVDAEHGNSNKAVDETRGMVITYNGDIIDALYHSNSGGVTASASEIYGNSFPYLVSTEDHYSANLPNSDWSISITQDDIKSGLMDNNINIGNIEDMEIVELSPTGRVTELKLIGTFGEATLRNNQIREVFDRIGLKSTWFTIGTGNDLGFNASKLYVMNGDDPKPKLINANHIYIIDDNFKPAPSRGVISRFINRDGIIEQSKPKTSSTGSFIITGKGYGHGVGMSQWGAQGMADDGYSFSEILKHYYKGTELTIIN